MSVIISDAVYPFVMTGCVCFSFYLLQSDISSKKEYMRFVYQFVNWSSKIIHHPMSLNAK